MVVSSLAALIFIAFTIAVAAFTNISLWETAQHLANPNIRTVEVQPGMRKEQVAHAFGKVLNWTQEQEQELISIHTKANDNKPEGYYLPARYIVSIKATPAEVSYVIQNKFKEVIVSKYEKLTTNTISLDTAVKIASIIEREAGSNADMKIISGVIWNRMFRGMTLDMDATLQYAKATSSSNWWPVPKAADKKIDSPYNTYKHRSLPPTAISNPGEKAIWAALNPPASKTIFYLHDTNGHIFTANTYKEHLANIQRAYYGN